MLFRSFLLAIVSCNDEKVVIAELTPDTDKGVENLLDVDIDEDNVLVWLYNDFLTPTDITITTPDTSLISVNAAFVEKLNHELKRNMILNIMLSDTDDVFIRKVISANKQGDRVVIGTEAASLEDVFKNLDVELDTEAYYDAAAASRSTSPYAGYMDKNRVLHPTRIVVHQEDGTKIAYYPAEMTAFTRAEMKFGIDWSTTITKEFANESETAIFRIKEADARLWANATIGVNIKWFKLQNFKADFKGGSHFDVPLELEFNSGSYIKHDKDEDLLSGKPMSALFWVGPIPISVSVTPTIKYIHNISVKGTAIARWGFYYDMNFRKGVKYARGSGWSPIKEFSQEYGLKPFEAEAQIETSAKVGVYAQMDVAIYGVEAAYVKVGGYIEGNAGVGWRWDIASSSQWEVNVNCNWGLEGPQFYWALTVVTRPASLKSKDSGM